MNCVRSTLSVSTARAATQTAQRGALSLPGPVCCLIVDPCATWMLTAGLSGKKTMVQQSLTTAHKHARAHTDVQAYSLCRTVLEKKGYMLTCTCPYTTYGLGSCLIRGLLLAFLFATGALCVFDMLCENNKQPVTAHKTLWPQKEKRVIFASASLTFQTLLTAHSTVFTVQEAGTNQMEVFFPHYINAVFPPV